MEPPRIPPSPDLPVLTGKRILLVDDTESVRCALRQYLVAMKLNVDAAANVDQSIEMLGRETYDLILSDYQMGSQTGADLYRHVKENHPRLANKFVLITSSTGTHSLLDFLKETGIPMLEKPFRPSEAHRVILSILKD